MDEKTKNSQWQSTCDHLKDAFDAWADLSRRELPPSADERQKQEFRTLLLGLKAKLEELSEAVHPAEPPTVAKPRNQGPLL